MAQIEVGRKYKDGRGRTVQILAQSQNSHGKNVFLGVVKDGMNILTGMSCGYYQDDGKTALVYCPSENLEVFDWRSLKKDDAVWLRPYTARSEAVARHVCRIDTENDLVYYYCDGVSSLTCDLSYHTVLHCPASEVIGLVKPRS